MIILVLSKKDLGKLIKTARKLRSEKIDKLYTQQMLANDIKASQSYIGDLESGRTYPSYVILNKIATACNVSISFFESRNINNDVNSSLIISKDQNYDEPKEIIKLVIKQPALINFLGIDINKLDDEMLSKFIDEFLENIKNISDKYDLK